MKVGDMVRYMGHKDWSNHGLGIITDTKDWQPNFGETYEYGCGIGDPSLMKQIIQITWLSDIKDFGWDFAIGSKSRWYDHEDYENQVELFSETN